MSSASPRVLRRQLLSLPYLPLQIRAYAWWRRHVRRERTCTSLLCGETPHSSDIYSNAGSARGPHACTQCLCTCASALRRTGVCFACDLAHVRKVVCVCVRARMPGRRGNGACDVAWHTERRGRCGTSAEEQAHQYQDRFFSKSLMGKAWRTTSSSCLKEQRAMSMEHRSRRLVARRHARTA